MPIKKNINLEDIRAFALIAQHGSFTAVSELLLCSRSHLSKQLNKLEARIFDLPEMQDQKDFDLNSYLNSDIDY